VSVTDPKQLIAVVGMSGRFPAAPDLDSLWKLMMERTDAIAPVPKERWDASEPLDPEKAVQAVGGFLTDVEMFDPTFFGISPREAEDIDPQQRLMLEASFSALEDAGEPISQLRDARVGVYVGASWHDYEILRKERGAQPTQHTAVGNALDMIAARVSYFLKLKGPSLTVETGCSSALVALHLASQALRAGDIEGAIVGGVNLILAPDVSIGLTHFGGLSPSGRCQAFAASADGFVRGEGSIALYLKTLERALADGDRVHSVIVRSVVNNDGGGDSLVTPFPQGQEDLLRAAYSEGIPLDRLAYVEAHGTGTGRGDPIEATAIGRVLGKARGRDNGPLRVGSLKTNIGHLEAAAGLAGLVKATLALEHGVVPPSLHADALNPAIPFEELNLEVTREPLPLPAGDDVFVGVNSFGWGGTNAHVVLKRAPVHGPNGHAEQRPLSESSGPVLAVLSAHNEAALASRMKDVREAVEQAVQAGQEPALTELAGTLARSRSQHAQRAAVVAESLSELTDKLLRFERDPKACEEDVIQGRARTCGKVAFVFPGQGSQWAAMGKQLYAANPRFAEVIRRCAQALRPFVSWDLEGFISGAAGDAWLKGIDTLQPTLWGMSVGLAELWREAGIEPDVVIGHSMGEVAAATVAGMLSYEDAARVIARRSAIAQSKAGKGQMLAVDLSLEDAQAALEGFEDRVSLAVNNGPTSCVLSGDTDAIGVLKELLDAEGVFCRLVRVDFASHSHQMDEFKAELFAQLEGVVPRTGRTALMSTVFVRELAGEEMDAAYWVKNLREPVLFAQAMTKAFDAGVTHVIEISPHPVLVPAIEQLAALRADTPSVLGTLRRDMGSPRDLAAAYARAYVEGLSPLASLPKAHLALPAYPWQRKRYWVSEEARRRGPRAGFEVTLQASPVEQGTFEGAVELHVREQRWLADHKVHEATVLPGVAMLQLAVQTARARTGALPKQLTDVRFREHVTLGQEPVRLSTLWRDDVTEGGSFTLLSQADAAGAGFTEHATARSERASAEAWLPAFPGALQQLAQTEPQAFYTACAARGLNYGPAFRGILQLHAGQGQALAHVSLPDALKASARPFGLHPALWDAALQVSLALVQGPETVVPTRIARVGFVGSFEPAVTSLWTYAVAREAGRYDLAFYTEDRALLMTLQGLQLEPLTSEQQAAAFDEAHMHYMTFAMEARPELGASVAEAGFALVGAAADTAPLAAALRELGVAQVACLEYAGAAGGEPEPEHLVHALRQGAALNQVVFVAPRSAAVAAHQDGLIALTALVRAVLSLPQLPRLTVVTARAQALGVQEPQPESGLYWGFVRALRREHAELTPTLIDVNDKISDWLQMCASELVAASSDDQVVLRQSRLVGRLARGARVEDAETAEPRLWNTPAQPFQLFSRKPGFFDALEYRPLTRRAPRAHEVEIEISAAALNFIDVMKAMGTYPGLSGPSALLGGECAGRVVRVGSDVSQLREGERVVACAFGVFASHVTVRADHVQPIPAHLLDEQAAALPLVMATAWYALHDLARLEAGERVLIHSAAGGLGLAAIQIAKLKGARILATAGSEDKRRLLREAGIEHVFNSRDTSWAEGVRAATQGCGVDVVLNSLTGAAISLGLDVLAEDGRFIEVGKKDIYGGRTLSLAPFKKGISIAAVDLAGLMERRPERFARLFRALWQHIASAELSPLPTLPYTFAQAPEALRAMSRGEHVGKFVLTQPQSVQHVVPEALPAGRFRDEATYLITGGLGALGLSLARFMLERGARSLLLLGRREPSVEAKATLAELEASGARVTVRAVDVADAAALGACLDEARANLPPLRGVIHAAGLLDDATVQNLTRAQLQRVLAPKLLGALNLDALTRRDALDLFVLFSSAAALFGNAGQAAYAAGNAAMDSLAERRHARGLPALSVHWGPFADIGLAAQDASRGARLSERGMGSFSADEAWRALEHFLQSGQGPVVGYVPIALRQWFDAYPDTAALKSWQNLQQTLSEGSDAAPRGEFLVQLHKSRDAARTELAEAKVRELAGRVLRLDPNAIDRDAPFKSLGLDSLMGLELRNRLESAFGLRLSPTLLWTYGNSRALAGVLCERVSESGQASAE